MKRTATILLTFTFSFLICSVSTAQTCGVTSLESGSEVTIICQANNSGPNQNQVTIQIDYTGTDPSSVVVNNSCGIISGDDPATVVNGIIIITGLGEGHLWDISIHCTDTVLNSTGIVPSTLCGVPLDTGLHILCPDSVVCFESDDCSDSEASGSFSFSGYTDCPIDSNLAYSAKIDFFQDGSIDSTIIGNQISGMFPAGRHWLYATGIDECGKQATCQIELRVGDCVPPIPKCSEGFEYVYLYSSNECIDSVVARSFNEGSSDNCTPSESLSFSFSPNNPADSVKYFEHSDTWGSIVHDIYITDQMGNRAKCKVPILILIPDPDCDIHPAFIVNLCTTTEKGLPLSNITVNGLTYTETSECMSFHLGVELEDIKPEKNVNPLNGVTTFDLILIQQHILGVQPLNSPYRMIAADVNQDGVITVLDIIDARKLILHIEDEFPNNTSWRFVDANYFFPTPCNPLLSPFPETFTHPGIPDHVQPFEFHMIGIKIGDVDLSADPGQ